MTLAITDEHRALAKTLREFLTRHESSGAARKLLTAAEETAPGFAAELAALGWLGLHVPEAHGGSGFGLPELAVVVEQLGRQLCPGPFVPTVVASAVLVAAGGDVAKRLLPGLADGSTNGAVGVNDGVELRDGALHGSAGVVLGAGLADVLLVAVGDDIAVVDKARGGVQVVVPTNLDPTRRSGRVTFDGAACEVLFGARRVATDLLRTILSAEAIGLAGAATDMGAEYAKIREQFGRPIAMFQAVKHHCANMAVATELATAAVWDAAQASAAGGDEFSFMAAVAATMAMPAADLCAQLNTQVHGGVGFTWEHDAHLYLRRATVMESLVSPRVAAEDATRWTRKGVVRKRSVHLPPEAEAIATDVRAFVAAIEDLDPKAQRRKMIETGYVMPHWPKPWGRAAQAVEQLVVEQEFKAAGIKKPAYGITGWVILTLIQHATESQVARWVPSALDQDVIWCQLFSEPGAGSDAAGAKTRGVRVEGGWRVTGQKVWTSGAHESRFGFATVRTNPDAPKHQGLTTMVIDMKAQGVEVRPLKMPIGASEFNEVFFDDVFVPDDDVVGPVDGGWTVARATLGNESVSIGGGQGGMATPGSTLVAALDAKPNGLEGGAARVGRYIATLESMAIMNMRSAHRAVAGGAPGPEGNITKLVLSEVGHDAAAMLVELAGPDGALMDGAGAMSGMYALMHRGLSIAGGTSEIKRNQIGERILGLPRDPLIR